MPDRRETEGWGGETSGLLERDGEQLAWRAIDGDGPTVVWLGGFKSDMLGTKAAALADAATELGWRFVRFDYSAHGESTGVWEEATIGRWRADALAVIDEIVPEGPLVLVGSSMGGWIACLIAMDRPERMHAMVLVAPAPDFTEALMRPGIPPEGLRELELNGVWLEPSEYDEPLPITAKLLDEGREHLILTGRVPIRCPVRILQGQRDEPVPWTHALKLADQMESEDVIFTLVKSGDHRLSTPEDIARLIATVEAVRG